ncbi:MAG: exodeoxyribonuclease III, partial [Candidatus Omnitrophica bacterium]|nr:exodeoxyribonuclease III [Candidatus Omnitrophota bacterium]
MAKKKTITLLSWNVNGIRAISNKGFTEWLKKERPDILCLQETKAALDQVPKDIMALEGYNKVFALGERKGYSGVGLLSTMAPRKIATDIGSKACDGEGRIIRADYDDFILFNVYFPNGNASAERLQYKLDFYKDFLKHVNALVRKGNNIVFCGDVNTAHTEIDLARPKENEDVSGFLPVERAWIDKVVADGFVDTFRMFTKEGAHYSWWDYKTRARERNVGWRIDYIFVNEAFKNNIRSAFIMYDIQGSDHCPIGV